ncbi:Inositolphosphorylceramide synthase subunit Kei1-domain-containing protein [Xylariales sp. PMI_506]|nr:Inositolphosphorylceramide synthase subunit Kei1-domain-containing protein [Xylariales sp. PMI_506]
MVSLDGFQLRVPRPKTFIGLMSLRTGTELIALALLFNKLTGLYGILAIFTGYHLSAIQLLSYVYSIAVLVLLALCMPHIRKQTPFQCLSLAWLYIIDTTVNTMFTTIFAVMWFLALGPDKQTTPEAETETSAADGFAGAVDFTTSMVLIVVLTLLRVYFMLVVMAFARTVLIHHNQSARQGSNEENQTIENPFAPGFEEGEGWRGKAGRGMVSVGKGYWLSWSESDLWAASMNSKFRGEAVPA